MKLAIMQPYFFPYIGYFQLIAAVDKFIVYDNIKYTKKGWVNRNRMLQNDTDVLFTLPLKSDSHSLDIGERVLDADFNRNKLLSQFQNAYRRAPYYEQTFKLIEQIVLYEDVNLFHFVCNSIVKICDYLDIKTKIKIASEVAVDHSLKNQDKVLALCKAVSASSYVNAIGGMELYSDEVFQENRVDLRFIRSKAFQYRQFGNEFVPWLSIIDVMMFNSVDVVKSQLTQFELIGGYDGKQQDWNLEGGNNQEAARIAVYLK